MSLILIISIAIRLSALGWSIILWRRVRDWRLGFLTVMLGLMALRQTLTLMVGMESGAISTADGSTELPGLAVSVMAFLAVFFLRRFIIEQNDRKQALRGQELMVQSLITHAPYSIWVCDGEGTVIFANQAALDMFGVTDPDQIIGRYNIYRDATEAEKPLLAYFEQAKRGEVVRYLQDLDMTTVKYDTSRRETLHFHTTLFAIRTGNGKQPHIVVIQEDVTEKVKAENRIHHLQNVLREIRNVDQLIVHEKNRQKLLQGACDILNKTRHYKLVWIGLIEEGDKNVRPVAQAGFDDNYLKSIKITWDDSATGKGPTGTAIRTGKPSIARDIANDPKYQPWRKQAVKRGYASSAAVPLVYEDRVYGALNVYASLPDAFDEEETDLLREVGQDLAFGLHIIELEEKRKRVEKELQKRRDENTRLTVIAKERKELQDWINTFDTFVGKFDLDGRGIMFNKAPLKAAGLTSEEVVGKYFPDTGWWSHSAVESARIKECFDKAKNGISSRIETSFRSADGTPVPIIFTCQPVMDEMGKVKYITAEGKIIYEEVRLRNALQREKENLETRVKERTAELIALTEKLKEEIAERVRTEEKLKKSYDQLHSLAVHLQSIREEERKQIAREIHDVLGQMLTALKMDLSMLGKGFPPDRKALINKITPMSDLVDAIIQTVKKIAMELRPGLLDDLGLAAAIEWQAEEFEKRTGISCEITTDPKNIVLDQERSTVIFRIFQEALTNVVRHSGATRVKIHLKKNADMISLIIEDNGQGITKEQMSKAGSFGILGMKERVSPWGGNVDVKGVKNVGTTVAVTVPINNERRQND